MADTTVAQIAAKGVDAAGKHVLTVYAKRPPLYAVYRTEERVVIQFADSDVEQDKQRTALATLNPLRGQINGLIDGWRSSKKEHLRADASRYDAQVADALVVALEKDVEGARSILELVKSDIVDKRTSWARLQYLITSTVAVLFFILLFILLHWCLRSSLPDAGRDLLIGAAAGSVGAFFSIALGIRSRTVLTDLHFWDNTADAVLRVIIGFIGGALLVALLESKLVTLSLEGARVDGNGGAPWLFILLAGFVAGFSERLVPDILAKATVGANKPAGAVKTSPQPAALVGTGSTTPLNKDFDSQREEDTDGEGEVDSCLCGSEVHDHEITPDTELPAASGGVAAPRAAAPTG
jgi:hypothetical protein